MGKFNLPHYHDYVPQILKDEFCVLCESNIIPIPIRPKSESFHYLCTNCNPRVIIGIAGRLLSEKNIEQLSLNSELKEYLIERLHVMNDPDFLISESDMCLNDVLEIY